MRPKRSHPLKIIVVVLVLSLPVLQGCGNFGAGVKRDSDDAGSDYDEDDPRPVEKQGSKADSDPHRRASSEESTEVQDLPRSPRAQAEQNWSEPNSSNAPVWRPKVQRQYRPLNRVTREDFIDASQDEGSLWASSGQTNYFFTKNRIKNPGDLVSLILGDELYRDLLAEIKRNLSLPEREAEINLAQENIKNKYLAEHLDQKSDTLTTSASAPESKPARTPASQGKPEVAASPAPNVIAESPKQRQEKSQELLKTMPRARPSDVDLTKALEVKAGDTFMGEVLERYPNGNYKVRAVRKIPYKNGTPRLVSVIGVVKGTDISDENDGIHSGRLYEYRIEVAH